MFGNANTENQRTIQIMMQKCSSGTVGCPSDDTFVNYIVKQSPAIWLYHNQKQFRSDQIGELAIAKSANIIQMPFESDLSNLMIYRYEVVRTSIELNDSIVDILGPKTYSHGFKIE